MSNPYESPQFVGQAIEVGPADREYLRRVARRQQWVLYALLAQIIVYMAMFAAQGADAPAAAAVLSLLFLGIAIFSMVAVFLLARELLHIVIAVICTVLMLVPCISLLTLVIVNGRATRLLQKHGVKVGLMGANPDLI